MIWLLAHPLPPSISSTGDTLYRKAEKKYTDYFLMGGERGKGAGEEPNHTTGRKLGPL
jgi:hypothetical protein